MSPLPPNRVTVISASVGLALLLGVLAYLVLGCGAQTQAQPAVHVVSLSGTGSAALELYGQSVEMSWAERGITADGELIHCSVLERLSVNGIHLGAGYLPPPLSDARCAEHYPPFRAGAPPITTDTGPAPEPGAGRAPGSASDSAGAGR